MTAARCLAATLARTKAVTGGRSAPCPARKNFLSASRAVRHAAIRNVGFTVDSSRPPCANAT